jgi:hypothetical protein
MGELSKVSEIHNYQLRLDEEEDDVAVPDLALVSDNSQSTTDSSSYLDDAGIRKSQSSPMLNTDFSSDAAVPSTVVQRGPSLRSTSDITLSNDRSSRRRQSVSFGIVEMKEFAMILGDHPDTEEGPAVGRRMI